MDDLYEQDERENSALNSVPQQISLAEVEDIPPDRLTTYTDNSRLAIIEQTNILSHKLKQCEQIVLNAYRVSDYVPNCDTKEQEEIWKGRITPILLQTINDDVVARWVMTDSFSAIRVLAITIQSAYEMIRITKGSSEAIDIAKQRIPEALTKIEKCIDRAVNLTDNGIRQFNENTQFILDIAGPEVAKNVMELTQYEVIINQEIEKENNFLYQLHKAEGDVIRYENLMIVVDNKRNAARKEIAEIEDQKKELEKRNMEIDNKKQNIPDKVWDKRTETRIEKRMETRIEKRTEQRVVKSTKSTWGGLSKKSKERLVDVQVDVPVNVQIDVPVDVQVDVLVNNPNKVSDQNYYDSIINARASHIAQVDGTAKAKEAVLKDLNDQYDKYMVCNKDAVARTNALEKIKEKTLREINDKIKANRQNIENTRKRATLLETRFGHNGQSLVDCLMYVKAFGKSLRGGTSAFSPLYTILTDIKAIVQLQVDMLKSSKRENVFVAGKMLMHQVEFLSEYNILAIEAVKQSESFNEVHNAINTKIEHLALKD